MSNLASFINDYERKYFTPLNNTNNFNNFYTSINSPIYNGGNKYSTPLINSISNIYPFFQQNYFNLNFPIFSNIYNGNKFSFNNYINMNRINTNINSLINQYCKAPMTSNENNLTNKDNNNKNTNNFGLFHKIENINNLNEFQNQKIFQMPYKVKSNNKSNIIINDSDELTFPDECKESPKIEITGNNTNVFNIVLKKKRGRLSTNLDVTKKHKRVHNASDYDNILRKVQVHFLSFLVNFVNEILSNFYPENKELRFQNLSYDIKKIVKHSYVEELKNKKIGEILPLKASSKFKKYDLNHINEIIYRQVCELNFFFKEFFELTCLEFFNEYYTSDKRKFIFDGKEIIFSEKTKFFNDLLQKNISAATKMKQIINTQFNNNKNNELFVVNKIS